jgi:hypothetical protein
MNEVARQLLDGGLDAVCLLEANGDGAKEHGEVSSHEADGSCTRQACIEERGARLSVSGHSPGLVEDAVGGC